MAPRTSILLPVFDGAAFLSPQIESILAQSDGNFELLAIDDGSRDESAAILASFAARDPRVRIVPSTGNAGQTRRLAELLAMASGQLVMIADQDDIWDIDRNTRLAAALSHHAIAFGRSELVDASDRPLGRTLLESLDLSPDPQARTRTLFQPLVSAHAAVFRREWIDPAVFAHPMPFDWLLSALALHGPGVVYVDDAVVRHRIHGGNQMNAAAPDTSRRFGALRNRLNFVARRPGQLRLWLMLDFLGRAAVEGARRRVFAELAQACRRTWFGVPIPRIADRALEARLVAALHPLAGSENDWRAAHREILRLTRSVVHPAKLLEAARAGVGV